MNDASLAGLLDTVWAEITQGLRDRAHPARHPSLATIGPEGPEVRTLVMRHADREAGTVTLHTDAASPKVAQIAADPRVALHIWIAEAQLQIRMRAMAEVVAGDREVFDNLPPAAQANYLGPIPGTPVGGSAPQTQGDGTPRFAQITCTLREIDALHLGTPHRRAIFSGPDWRGHWIAP